MEGAERMEGDASTRWAVENMRTKSRVWIFPDDVPPDEEHGSTDAFCVMDANIRKYRECEDAPWPFHTKEMDFQPQENPDGRDVVFWYVSHLKHIPEKHADPWHCVGPTLLLDPAPSKPAPPGSTRSVSVDAEIVVTHSAALKADVTETFQLS